MENLNKYEPVEYKGRKIIPIMQPMLVWDGNGEKAVEKFIYVKEDDTLTDYPWIGREGGGDGNMLNQS